MSTGYSTRQSVISDGNIGYDSLWNNEYNAILAAFTAITGHTHDGSAGEGGYVPFIADVDKQNYIAINTASNQVDFYLEVAGAPVLQFSLKDGVFEPAVDNDVDLGTAIKAFKDLYIAGAATIASAAISGGTIDNTIIGGTTPAAGSFTTVDINGGTVDGATIGATTATTGRFTTVESTVTTGTAPLIVASTTVVTNLNADKLDGQDAPTGAIVGTTDSQTLTNKTLTAPTINDGTTNLDGGVLVLPQTTTPAQTAEGSVVWDSDNDLLTVGDGVSRKTMVDTSSAQTLTTKTIVVASNVITTAASGNLTSTELNAALAELQADIDTRALDSALSAHLTDTVDAHDASAISNVAAGNIVATDVQAAINELDGQDTTIQTNLDNHINDTVGAHAASAISNTPAGDIAATDVQTAINELDTDKVPRTSTTGEALLPAGTTAQRNGTPVVGHVRFNADDNKYEGYYGAPISNWQELGGGQMLGAAATKAIFYNAQTIAEDITIGATQNGLSAGPITIADTYTVTITSGGNWTIVGG